MRSTMSALDQVGACLLRTWAGSRELPAWSREEAEGWVAAGGWFVPCQVQGLLAGCWQACTWHGHRSQPVPL